MLPEFIAALKNAELNMTAEEIADTLWLALQMDSQHEKNELHSPHAPHSHVHDNVPVDQHPPLSLPAPSVSEEASASIYLNIKHHHNDNISDITIIPFRSPAAAALPNALALTRALRPFMRRLPSKTAVVLNERATVQRIAETRMDLWIPVFDAAPVRWFDVELVVDIGTSMMFWKETITELQALLERLGAFRDVRFWRLATDDSNSVDMYAGLHSTQARNPKELINPGGYRLLLVVSDCISPAWHSGKVQELLNMWGRKNLVTLLQVLPRRLWSQTMLEDADIVQVYPSQSKASNQYLKSRNTLRDYDKDSQRERSLPFPVITLEPKSLLSWANVLTGTKKTWVIGAIFEQSHDDISLEEMASNNQVEADDLSPKKRVRLFQTKASSLARKLAGLLAVAPIPISLPVVRQVQITMLQAASQVHIAEVFLGGLLEEIYRDEIDQNPDLIQYDFIAGVRNELINAVPIPDAHRVLKNVSQFVQDHYGQPRDFQAIMALPQAGANQDMSIRKGSRPFAQIDLSALRRFGGTFSALVDKIKQQNELYRSTDPHQTILETSPEYSTTLANPVSPDLSFIGETWCGFSWTTWLPLNSSNLPAGSGIYRIRAVGGNEIFYIGSTGRNLKERIGDLYRNVMKDPTQMPFSDPHTAAPALWAWKDATGIDFECSALSLPSENNLEMLVHYFLWKYRLEKGHSTLANHGRFHPDYKKSDNRSTGQRGYRLPEESSNPARGSEASLASLSLEGMPLDRNWMGLKWSEEYPLIGDFKNIELSPAVYKVMDMDGGELLFVGSTPNLRNRLQDLKQKIWNCPHPVVAFVLQSPGLSRYQLDDLKDDLLGGYYEQMKKAPKSQFGAPQLN